MKGCQLYREESVPEAEPKGQSEHEPYAMLCALAAGGLLEGEESSDFQSHLNECSRCRADFEELSGLVARDLPQGQSTLRQTLAVMRAKPVQNSRDRFLRRARAEGLVFSRDVESSLRSGIWYGYPVIRWAAVAALVVAASSVARYHFRETPGIVGRAPAAAPQIAELERRNSALTVDLSRLNESLATGQREIENLRAQLAKVGTTAENLRRQSVQARSEDERSSSQNGQLLDETRNQAKLLAEAKDEAARSSQLRINSEASLVEQQYRITELSNKLRIASATLDMERQLAAAGKDIPELMAARQLHVIDVRDTDPNGDPSKAFGRVFLTEGKSLMFYAFDLNENNLLNAKHSFQVWAASEAGKNSAHSLGLLRVDAKAPGRWVLKVENPELLKEVSSVFVTVAPAAGGKQPSGQKMLYAYLGVANHP
jgi:uncharacterized coiled-coil protein SlyX